MGTDSIPEVVNDGALPVDRLGCLTSLDGIQVRDELCLGWLEEGDDLELELGSLGPLGTGECC